MSDLQWKVMSRLVIRCPTAAKVADGTWRSWRVASGLIWGPMKRMDVRWESSTEIPRFLIARAHAASQPK